MDAVDRESSIYFDSRRIFFSVFPHLGQSPVSWLCLASQHQNVSLLCTIPARGQLEKKYRKSHSCFLTQRADRYSVQKKGPVQLRTGPVGWYKVMSRCLVAVSLADTVELDGCSVCSVPGSIHCPVALVCSTFKGTVHLQYDPMASPPLR